MELEPNEARGIVPEIDYTKLEEQMKPGEEFIARGLAIQQSVIMASMRKRGKYENIRTVHIYGLDGNIRPNEVAYVGKPIPTVETVFLGLMLGRD